MHTITASGSSTEVCQQLELLTIQNIIYYSQDTARSKLRSDGAPVRAATVRKIAKALQVKATDIARFN